MLEFIDAYACLIFRKMPMSWKSNAVAKIALAGLNRSTLYTDLKVKMYSYIFCMFKKVYNKRYIYFRS